MSVDLRDAALQASCPCVPVPVFSPLPPASAGQRLLVARNGLFLQVVRDWLDCTLRVAPLAPTPPLPYGAAEERLSLAFDGVPADLLAQFLAAGRAALPNEIAGGLIYCRTDGRLKLQLFDSLAAGPAHVHYRMPRLWTDESLVMDLHTHGHLAACWSTTDDADDQGVKVCGVFGELDRPEPSMAFRLAVNGHFRALRPRWSSTGGHLRLGLDCEDGLGTLDRLPSVEALPWNT